MPKSATADEVRQMNLLKLILIDHPSAIKGHHDALADLLSPRLGALTESEPEYLEVLSPEASKGLGLKVLSESLSIAQSETAAIGDYLNDLEMVQWAGIGAAMANAQPEVKSIAQVEVATNNDAGVAEFIDYLIERNKSES
jgi:hydroxymethylpyrimidine pyrophosphatase-like HAD family hydrolase